MANQYLVQPDPLGPEPGYGQIYPEPVAEGPVDTDFALNGQNMREYVTGCLSFMQYMKDMVEGMLRTLPKNRRFFDTDLTCLIDNIGEKMDEQSHVTLALECLQDARWMRVLLERQNYSEDMALYRCADEGRQLMQTYYFQLRKLPPQPDAQVVAPLLNSLIRALNAWLAGARGFQYLTQANLGQ